MRRRLGEARVGHLASVAASGAPHVVPVCFALEGDAIYWAVDQKPKATRRLRRLANLLGNPISDLVADHYEEDWSALWWVRVEVEATVLEAGLTESEHGLDLLAAKYPQYRERRPDGPVVRLAIRRWSGWSASAL
jgi:PPOX class probable F420-dependent enzyme